MRRRLPINQLLYYKNYQFVLTGNNTKGAPKNHNKAFFSFLFSGFPAMHVRMSAVKENNFKV